MASLVHGVVHRAMWVFFGSVFTIVKWGGGALRRVGFLGIKVRSRGSV